MQPATCLNCEAALSSEQKFCGKCGQTAHLHRLDLHYVLHEGAHFVTHTDKSIFSLIGKLSYQPGHVARQFIQGKRKRFLGPLNFYLIIIGIFVLASSTFKTFERPVNYPQWRAEIKKIPDPVERERKLAKIDRSERATGFVSKHSNLVNMLVATPLASLIFFLFYRKRGFNYTEHLVSNFYFAGFTAIVFILIITPIIRLTDNTSAYLASIACFLAVELVYRSVAYYQLMNRKGARHYLYALLASATTIVAWALLSRWVITKYIETGFYL